MGIRRRTGLPRMKIGRRTGLLSRMSSKVMMHRQVIGKSVLSMQRMFGRKH